MLRYNCRLFVCVIMIMSLAARKGKSTRWNALFCCLLMYLWLAISTYYAFRVLTSFHEFGNVLPVIQSQASEDHQRQDRPSMFCSSITQSWHVNSSSRNMLLCFPSKPSTLRTLIFSVFRLTRRSKVCLLSHFRSMLRVHRNKWINKIKTFGRRRSIATRSYQRSECRE